MKYSKILIVFLLTPFFLKANNIEVNNVTLASQNALSNFYMVEFDLSWENSWRTSTFESNWDAAWVFIKFTPKNLQEWQHAALHYVNGTNDGHVAPAGCTITTANNSYGSTDVGRGVLFIEARMVLVMSIMEKYVCVGIMEIMALEIMM